MVRAFVFFCILLSSCLDATPFKRLPMAKEPTAANYIAVMPGAQATSNEYLGDGNDGRSNIYIENAIHTNFKVPSIHAYNPGTYRFAVIELDPVLKAFLPDAIQQHIPNAEVERLFISIERLDTNALCFRPHRFVDRNAPTYAKNTTYNNAPQIQAGVFGLDGVHIPFTDLRGAGLVQAGISIHAAGPRGNLRGTQLLSPNNMRLPAVPHNPSRAYYSIVSHNDGKTRAAVTLHWLINKFDENEMWQLLRNSPTIQDFSRGLNRSSFNRLAVKQAVQNLIPIVAIAHQAPHRAGDNDDDDDDDNNNVEDLAAFAAGVITDAFGEAQGEATTSSTTSTPLGVGPFETNLDFWKPTDGLTFDQIERTDFGGFEVTYLPNSQMQSLTYELPIISQDTLRHVVFTGRTRRVNGMFTVREGNNLVDLSGTMIKFMNANNDNQEYRATFMQEAGKSYKLYWSKDETESLDAVLCLENFELTTVGL